MKKKKRVLRHGQVGFTPGMQDWLNIQERLSVIPHINRTKRNGHLITSIHAEKAFNEIQHPFLIFKKDSSKVGKEGNFLNVVQGISQGKRKPRLTSVDGENRPFPTVARAAQDVWSRHRCWPLSGRGQATCSGASEPTACRRPTHALGQVRGLASQCQSDPSYSLLSSFNYNIFIVNIF